MAVRLEMHVAGRIEDYALIGDMQTAALVCRDGTVDWLCLPRFDSHAIFAGLLGTEEHGFWRLGPAHAPEAEPPTAARRTYRGDSLILESEWDTPRGTVRVTDFMPPRDGAPQLIRIVEGISGRVPMRSALRMRFSYGRIVPWVHKVDSRTVAVAGPDSVWLDSTAETYGKDLTTYSDFTVAPGDRIAFTLSWQPSHLKPPALPDPEGSLEATEEFWGEWVEHCTYHGPYREAVVRSLITLKALTYAPTGGIVAAPTTSLPEEIGGVRNWDYRYTWLRDAAITLSSCCAPATARRPVPGGTGCFARSPATPRTCRSCTGSRASVSSARQSSTGCPATRTRRRCGSATARRTSSSSTCTARSPRRCTWHI